MNRFVSLARRGEAWKDAGAGAMLALFVVAFFWRTLSGDVYQPADGGDLVSFLFPTYRFAARTLSEGHLPLWNPTLYAGAPFISDIQAGFLYPPDLLLFWLNPHFEYVWMQWLSIGHLWWAGLGVYVLVRVIGFSRPAALLAGTAFALSDPLLIHLGNYNLIAVLAWIGWILAAYHRAVSRRSLRWAAITALLFAVSAYAGHAQSSYYVGMALGGYWILAIGDWRWGHAPLKARFQSLLSNIQYPISVLLLTFLLTAPLLLPSFEMVQYTARADFAYQETVAYSLAPVPGIMGLVTPGFFGRGPALHWSLWDRVELPYAGVVTLLLALAAFWLPLAEKRRRLLPWIGLALLGFIIALGIYTPVHGWLTQILPGFAQFRAPARAIVLFTLALSVLAAAGLDALLFQRKDAQVQRRKGEEADTLHPSPFISFLRWSSLALLLFILPAIYSSLLVLQPDSVYFLRASLAGLAMMWVVLAWLGTALLVWLHARGTLSAHLFAGLLLALLLVELSATGAYTDIAESNPAAKFDHPEIVAFLRQQTAGESSTVNRQSSILHRIDTLTDIDDVWQPDTAALAGLEDVGGIVNPLALRHWTTLWEATGGRDTHLYDMLNVRYVIVKDETPLPEQFVRVLDAPGPLSVYENPDPLPRAWLVTNTQIVEGEAAALAALQSPEFDPRQTAILTTDRRPQTADRAIPNPQYLIANIHTTPTVLSLSVVSPTPATLVLSEIWYPGWRATVNGVETPVLRANYALRAVPVPAGDSTVTLTFAPTSWGWGLALGIVGLLGVMALLYGKRS